jgi:hypothetical protein
VILGPWLGLRLGPWLGLRLGPWLGLRLGPWLVALGPWLGLRLVLWPALGLGRCRGPSPWLVPGRGLVYLLILVLVFPRVWPGQVRRCDTRPARRARFSVTSRSRRFLMARCGHLSGLRSCRRVRLGPHCRWHHRTRGPTAPGPLVPRTQARLGLVRLQAGPAVGQPSKPRRAGSRSARRSACSRWCARPSSWS